MPARMLIRHSDYVRISSVPCHCWIDPTLLKESAVCGISACLGVEVRPPFLATLHSDKYGDIHVWVFGFF